ncbi:PAS domain-containing sensor histidine kinase [Lysinibacter sp. HNR]|uniref:sensor histidine kinase n=1 Tax=Lysinibacter sp. HNR TaxID=3031408 RepID=UPI002435AFC0|nr:PAS domain-containing sensor histidine kinase [Lysinibacter sp. HNR]WGD38133.1 histidine kinase N-terminal domain-containing protein [Lysinibacter sp. HNR]
MSTLSDLISQHGSSQEGDIEWLHSLVRDGQLLADLAFADVVFWAPTNNKSFIAVAHARPSSAATLFYRDVVTSMVRAEWQEQVGEAYLTGKIIESASPAWFEEMPMKVRAIPVTRSFRGNSEGPASPIAVITAHTNLSDTRTPSRLEAAFTRSANDIFQMIAVGDFPDWGAPTGPRRGAPRASDGLLRLDVDGVVTFASPNSLSAFNRMGFVDELEGESLAEITTALVSGSHTVDESLPVVVTGRAPWRTDVESGGVTLSIRAIPVKADGVRTGALVLTRDVSELRHQEQELITKDATIREIHHRVKNNLQTVASLLRIQARRARSDEAQEALGQAMRRVAAIAVVHDTLAIGISQNVDFDEVFDRVLMLVAEVASTHNTTAHPKKEGEFGVLPSEYATPLALALTELVTNAVEHGLAGQEGSVTIRALRNEDKLCVAVIDTGLGLPEGHVGTGLGTQIVRTLIQGELGGTIDWHTSVGSGTEVTIEIPLRWLKAAEETGRVDA